jgi:glutamate racemase
MNVSGDSAPLGIFDSGVGGLTVLKAIRELMPGEDIVYAADSGHVPYGNKSRHYIESRSLALAGFLVGQGAKAIVVACNTATAAAAETLRSRLSVPIIAMEPALKPAAAVTTSGVIGVLATEGTLASSRFAALLDRYGHDVRVVVQTCPGLVEQVEAGDLDGPKTRLLVAQYTAPLVRQGADVIVLGCTHYPFLRPIIAELAGPGITLVDTGPAVAQQVKRVLEQRGLLNRGTAGSERFWATGDVDAVQKAVCCLWGNSTVNRLPEQS